MDTSRNSGEMHEPGAGRLCALAGLGARLAAADRPLEALGAALPAIVAHLAAESGRLVADSPEGEAATGAASVNWPERGPAGGAGLRATIAAPAETPGREVGPIAAIEIRGKGGPGGRETGLFDAEDRGFLDTVAQLAGLCCTRAALRAELVQQQRIVQDLALAAELQRSLQPDCDPDQMPIWGVNRPARHVSGDFFDVYRLDDDRYAFSLGDVSGKGVNAALLMAKTISLFRCLAKRIDRPAALLEAINAELCETASRGMFVTMVAGQYSRRDGRVRFANAGHEPPLLRRKDRTYEVFPAGAPPLGIVADSRLNDEEIDLAGGEFYVFSDGLTEYRYASGEQLGVDGLIQVVEVHAAEPPAKRLEALLDMLDEDAGWEARDDLTVLAIDDSWVGSGTGSGRGTLGMTA